MNLYFHFAWILSGSVASQSIRLIERMREICKNPPN